MLIKTVYHHFTVSVNILLYFYLPNIFFAELLTYRNKSSGIEKTTWKTSGKMSLVMAFSWSSLMKIRALLKNTSLNYYFTGWCGSSLTYKRLCQSCFRRIFQNHCLMQLWMFLVVFTASYSLSFCKNAMLCFCGSFLDKMNLSWSMFIVIR